MQGVGCKGAGCGVHTLLSDAPTSGAAPHAVRTPLRVQGSCFRVQGAGFRVQGSGFRVQGSGSRVQGSGLRVQVSGFGFQGSGFRFQGSGFRVHTLLSDTPTSGAAPHAMRTPNRVQASGFRV